MIRNSCFGNHFGVKIQFEGIFALFISSGPRQKLDYASIKKAILHSMTHSFAFTFKEMLVSVTVYFKVECIMPRRLIVR
jgi:hypothetical protein